MNDSVSCRKMSMAFALCCLGALLCVCVLYPQCACASQVGSISLTAATSTADSDKVASSGSNPVEGVNFTLSKLSDYAAAANGDNPLVTVDSLPLDSFPAQSLVTDASGQAKFTNLEQGVYVVETSVPQGYQSLSKFLVAVPMTSQENSAGETWDVSVYPKLQQTSTLSLEVPDNKVLGVGDQTTLHTNMTISSDLRSTDAKGSTVPASELSLWLQLDAHLDCSTSKGSTSISILNTNGSTVGTLDEGIDYIVSYDASRNRTTLTCTESGLKKVADTSGGRTLSATEVVQVNESAYDTTGKLPMKSGYTIMPATTSTVSTASMPFISKAALSLSPVAATSASAAVTGESNEASITVGGIAIDKYLSDSDTRLEGAHFKVATSKENAAQGTFLQRSASLGAAATDIELVTNAQGYAEIGGLGSGSYVLVETQAPHTIDESGNDIECTLPTETFDVVVKSDVSQNVSTAHIENHASQTQSGSESASQSYSEPNGTESSGSIQSLIPATNDEWNIVGRVLAALACLAGAVCLLTVSIRFARSTR